MKIPLAIFFSTLSLLATNNASAQDAALIAAEQARGIMTGANGVQWTVQVKSSDGRTASFRAVSQSGKIWAEVLAPADAKGRKYIAEAKGSMWFWKPGLSRPVPVSKRQRLSGDAAIGDIASTSYVDGYKMESSSDGEVDGEAATIYILKANSISDTYREIRYWVTRKGSLGKKAEFYAKSGTLIRTSKMEYRNKVNGRPFLSKMAVKDSSKTINLTFSDVKMGNYSAALFEKKNLGK